MSLKEKAANALSHLLRRLSKKRIILFESLPDFSDNTLAVFREMIRRGYDKKYRLVWELGDANTDTALFDQYGCKYILRDYHTLPERLQHFYYTAAADVLISSNRFLKMQSSDGSQRYMHLAHGCALKKTTNYYFPDYIGNADVLTLSDFFLPYDAVNLGCRQEQLRPLGYPRCDELFKGNVPIAQLAPESEYQKVIYWMPTYRQHNSGKYVHSDITFPIIYNDEIARRINDVAVEQKVLILIKPHPAQDLSVIKALQLSNLFFIDNDFLKENGITNYELLGSCDALLSDYSSVYYDYLLCDKPIGLCFDDYEDYVAKEGFTVNPDYILKGGEKLYTADDLCRFIQRVAAGEDTLREARNEIAAVVHRYRDNHTSQRVVDYIEKEYFSA